MVQKRAEGVSQVHSEVKGLVHVSVTSVSEVILDDPVQTAEEYKRNSVSNTHPHVASAIPFSQLDRLPPPHPPLSAAVPGTQLGGGQRTGSAPP